MIEIIKNIFAESGAFNGLMESCIRTAEIVRIEAVNITPLDKGPLNNSIMVKYDGGEKGFNEGRGMKAPIEHKLTLTPKKPDVYIGTNSDHWYPEFGTRNQDAQPFLRPAGEIVIGGNTDEVIAKYNKEEMRRAFRKKKVVSRG